MANQYLCGGHRRGRTIRSKGKGSSLMSRVMWPTHLYTGRWSANSIWLYGNRKWVVLNNIINTWRFDSVQCIGFETVTTWPNAFSQYRSSFRTPLSRWWPSYAVKKQREWLARTTLISLSCWGLFVDWRPKVRTVIWFPQWLWIVSLVAVA